MKILTFMVVALTIGIVTWVVIARYKTRGAHRLLAERLERTRTPAVTPDESPYRPYTDKQVPLNPRKPDPLASPRPARPKFNPERLTLRDDNIHTTPVWPSTTTYGGSSGYHGSSHDTSSDSGSSGGGGSDGGGGGGE